LLQEKTSNKKSENALNSVNCILYGLKERGKTERLKRKFFCFFTIGVTYLIKTIFLMKRDTILSKTESLGLKHSNSGVGPKLSRVNNVNR
jgi:hypothetical protein